MSCKCSECFKSTSMICDDCTTCTQVQFHSTCMFHLISQINAVSSVKLDASSGVVVMA